MKKTITIPYKRAKHYHCITKIWDLWIKGQDLSRPDQARIAKQWRSGAVDLVVNQTEFCKILGRLECLNPLTP